jgi:hypothetical protein
MGSSFRWDVYEINNCCKLELATVVHAWGVRVQNRCNYFVMRHEKHSQFLTHYL